MKLVQDSPITHTTKAKVPNPFMDQAKTLMEQTTTASIRVNLEPNDKTYQVIGWLREAANSVGKGLSVAFDEADNTDEKRKLARTFRFAFVTKRNRRSAEEIAAEKAAKEAAEKEAATAAPATAAKAPRSRKS